MQGDLNGPELQLGRILVEWGMVSEEALNECLDLQRQLEKDPKGYVPRLGELLVERGHATADMILEALGAQNRRVMYCPTCKVNVNVDIRPDIFSYRCGKCQTELTQPPSSDQLKVGDSTIMVVTKDPLPNEVQDKLQEPAAKFGKYILVAEIGRGGVGVVYKAWDTYLGQFVALKRLKAFTDGAQRKPGGQEIQIQSLLKEARSAVRLRHPHIATVYDIGRIQQEFYMSMEYLEGRTLATDLQQARSRGQVSPFFEAPKKFLRFIRDVARALHYAHTRPAPVIHCDMKPSNIFLTVEDRAYILDFGLARNLRGLQDEPTGTISGTPSYMAPEQASGRNEDIDARTDVYGLGAILYELLTGRPPFLGSVHSVMRKSIAELPDRPTEVLSLRGGDTTRRLGRIPAGLEELLMRCLEKERGSRFQTAHEVANALDRLLKGDSSTGRLAPGVQTPSPVSAPAATPPGAETRSPTGSHLVPTPQAAQLATITPTPLPSPATPRSGPAPSTAAAPSPLEGRSKAWIQKAATFAAGVLVTSALFFAIAWFSSGKTPADRVTVQSLEKLLVDFRPDEGVRKARQALEEPRSQAERERIESIQEQLYYLDAMRSGLVAAIDRNRGRIELLKLRTREIQGADMVKASDRGLWIMTGEEPTLLPWGDLHPEQFLSLARAALKSPSPTDRLGLAIWAWHAGLKKESTELLDSLKGTELDAQARRFLGRFRA